MIPSFLPSFIHFVIESVCAGVCLCLWREGGEEGEEQSRTCIHPRMCCAFRLPRPRFGVGFVAFDGVATRRARVRASFLRQVRRSVPTAFLLQVERSLPHPHTNTHMCIAMYTHIQQICIGWPHIYIYTPFLLTPGDNISLSIFFSLMHIDFLHFQSSTAALGYHHLKLLVQENSELPRGPNSYEPLISFFWVC